MSESKPRNRRTRFASGSRNVFADIGIAESGEALAKARLAEALDDTMRRRGLTQEEAARIMGVGQPTVSRIVNGRLDGFSQQRLIRYLTALGDDVEIIVHRRDREGEGRVTVTVD